MPDQGLIREEPGFSAAARPGTPPSRINDISPEDIESVEIIKGPAAATLYGTEASNGVIQIFTKRGRTGRPVWTLRTDQSVSRYLQPFGTALKPYMGLDRWMRTGWHQQYALSVAGGTDTLRYFASAGLEHAGGNFPDDRLQGSTVRGNVSFRPLPALYVDLTTSLARRKIQNVPMGNNAEGLALNVYRIPRNYIGSADPADIDRLFEQDWIADLRHFIGGATLRHEGAGPVSQKLTVGYDGTESELIGFFPYGFITQPLGVRSVRRWRSETVTVDYVATLALRSGEATANVSVGGQSVSTEETSVLGHSQEFPGPGNPTLTSGASTRAFEERIRVVNAGAFGQVLLGYRDRYFLTAGLRADGNSAFGRDLGLQAYPKASVSYVVSDEPFWNPRFGQLKLRLAWGQAGRAPGAFDAVRTWNPVGWGGQPAFFPLNVGNPRLGPERTTEIEAGLDGSFLGDRLTAEFSWYNQTTTDALFFVRQIPSLGFLQSQLRNVGKLRNRGIELALTGELVRAPRFGWQVGGSVYTNFSAVLDLGGAPPFSLGDFGWIVGPDSTGRTFPVPLIRANCVENADERAEPKIRADCPIGPNLPTHTYGVHTTFRLPLGITFTARGEYQGGHYMYDGAAYNAVVRAVRWPGCFDFYRLQELGRAADATALQRARCIVSNTRPDYFVYPADFFKVREVTVSVPVPQRWIPGASSALLTLSGRNVWKWVNDGFPVFEPEMGANEGFNTQVRSLFEHVPPPAIYTASLRVTF